MNLLAAFTQRRTLLPLFLAVCLALNVPAQAPDIKDPDVDQLIRELFPVLPEDADPEELFEFFFQMLSDPADINEVSGERLASIFILNEEQIRAFIAYRNTTGAFLSLYELQAIPGWDLTTIRQILPFLTLAPRPVPLARAFRDPTQHFLLARTRLVPEKQKGFTPVDPGSRSVTRYAGSPWQWYARYRYARTGAFSAGITLEKDAGETWNWTPSRQAYGVDFTSFHFQLLNRGRLKSLTLGDYQVQAGQGLVFASGFSLGKGSEVIRNTYRSAPGTRPYSSVIEQGFFRGAAATWEPSPGWEATLFYSRKRRDGTIAGKGILFDSEVITSFPTDGYHRTPNEKSKHGNILEQNAGGHLLYNARNIPLRAGLTALHTVYSLPVEKRQLPYNAYEFKGTSQTIIGVHASFRLGSTHLFSESARSSGGGAGAVAGAVTALSKRWDMTLLGRIYQRHFHTFYGSPFKENSRPVNEQGLYIGIRHTPSRKWQHSAYLDLFRFPGKRYLVDTSSAGNGFFLHTQWKPRKTFKAYALVQREQKQRNNRGDDVPPLPLVATVRTTALLNLEWSRPMRYTLRTRIQGGSYRFGNLPPSLGFTIAQDATLKLKKLELSGRVALFRTDDYDSRQYVSEKNVLYSFSIPAYYDHGTRHYLMIRYDLTRRIRIWARWSRTGYSRLETIGSGLDEIQGNRKSEIKFQVMYRML